MIIGLDVGYKNSEPLRAGLPPGGWGYADGISKRVVVWFAFKNCAANVRRMSLSEIKTAVDALSADELTELAAFVRERENRAWDQQIDADFTKGGRLSSIAEEARADIRAGRLQDLP
jgi:hypothetical protein